MTIKESLVDDEWLKLRIGRFLNVDDIDILFVLDNSIEGTARKIHQAVHAIIEAWKGPANDRSTMFKYETSARAAANALKLDKLEPKREQIYIRNCDTLTTASGT